MVSSAGTTVSSLLPSRREPRRDYSLKVRRLCLIIRARKLVHAFHLSGTWWEIVIGGRGLVYLKPDFRAGDVSYTGWRRVPTCPPFRSDICARFPCPAICSRLWHHLLEGYGIYTAWKLHATCTDTIYANLFFLARNSKPLWSKQIKFDYTCVVL